MGNTDGIVRLYRAMRFALLLSVPMAAGLFFYACTGLGAISLMFAGIAFGAVLDTVPEPKEIRRILRNKSFDQPNHIWYMIEDRVTGDTRMM